MPSPESPHPTEVFDSAVWDVDGICNACFQRVQRVDPDDGPGDVRRLYPDGIEAFDQHDRDEYGVRAEHRPRVACACGSIGLSALDRTLSTSEAIGRVPALLTRLSDAGIAADADVLYDSVRALKAHDGEQHDDHVFRTAVAAAVQAA